MLNDYAIDKPILETDRLIEKLANPHLRWGNRRSRGVA